MSNLQAQKTGIRYVYGKNSVKAVLEKNPETVSKIFISNTLKPDKRITAIQVIAHQYKIPVQLSPRQKLDTILASDEACQALSAEKTDRADTSENSQLHDSTFPLNHQGIIAAVAAKAILDLQDIINLANLQKESGIHPVVLVLDGIMDPRNLGAILRVADAAGVTGVIMPRHHSAGLSPAVSKTASGAEETVSIAMVGNLTHALTVLKTHGFWVYGTAISEEATTVYHQTQYTTPVVLVVGNEEKGIGHKIKQHCDVLISIPMLGSVESLNVSAATAILLYELVRQRFKITV
jgi:23S rRNA (guanosine2251-2'-O)-methyltransferase